MNVHAESQGSFAHSPSDQHSKQVLSLLLVLGLILLMCLEWAESTASRFDTLRKFSMGRVLDYMFYTNCMLLVECAFKLYAPDICYWFTSMGVLALHGIYCAFIFARLVLCLLRDRLGWQTQIHVNSANLNWNENPEMSLFEPHQVVPDAVHQIRLQVAPRAGILLLAVAAMVLVKLRSCLPQFIGGLLCIGLIATVWLLALLLKAAGAGALVVSLVLLFAGVHSVTRLLRRVLLVVLASTALVYVLKILN